MRRAQRLIPVGAGALAALTAGLAVASLIALNGGGATMVGGHPVLELASGYDRESRAALAAARPTPAVLRRAQALSRRAIELNPYDNAAWLKLATTDRLIHGTLTPRGVAALRMSYNLVAIDPFVATWRVEFALENWSAIPKDLRAEVRAEAMTLGAAMSHRDKILTVLTHVRNPAARMTASLWASRIQRSATK